VLKKGQLVRWVVDYEVFAAYSDSSGVKGIGPIYKYGIVMEVGKGNKSIVVCCYEKEDAGWILLHLVHDKIEVVSEN